MQANAQTNVGPTEILCRLMPDNTPVVVIAHSFDGNQVQIWSGKGDELVMLPKHEYDRTRPLAKADEDTMAKRFEKQFKGSQPVVRHRLPRQERERPVLFGKNAAPQPGPLKDINEPPKGAQNNGQPQQAAAPAATPMNTTTPAALPFVGDVPATDMSSADILEKIKEARGKVGTLAHLVQDLTAQLQQATSEQTAANAEYSLLTAQYQAAIKREAEEFQRKQQEALQAVLAPPADAIDNLQQVLQEAGAQPAGTAAATPAPAPEQQQQAAAPADNTPVRGPGGKFQKKPGSGSGRAKTIEAQQGPAQSEGPAFTTAQLEAMLAAQRAREGGKGQQPKK